MHFPAILATLAVVPLTVTGLGINCRGSSNCGPANGNLQDIANYISRIDTNRVYTNGQQIACTGNSRGGGLCAFLQNSPSQNGGQIKNLIAGLQAHGCKKCGSNPTQPGNDVSKGQLTVNYVTSPCGSKLC